MEKQFIHSDDTYRSRTRVDFGGSVLPFPERFLISTHREPFVLIKECGLFRAPYFSETYMPTDDFDNTLLDSAFIKT